MVKAQFIYSLTFALSNETSTDHVGCSIWVGMVKMIDKYFFDPIARLVQIANKDKKEGYNFFLCILFIDLWILGQLVDAELQQVERGVVRGDQQGEKLVDQHLQIALVFDYFYFASPILSDEWRIQVGADRWVEARRRRRRLWWLELAASVELNASGKSIAGSDTRAETYTKKATCEAGVL